MIYVDLFCTFRNTETEILRRCSEISRTMRFRWDLKKKNIKFASVHHFIIFHPLPLHSQLRSFRASIINSPHSIHISSPFKLSFINIHYQLSFEWMMHWIIRIIQLLFELMRIIIHHFEFASIRSATWRLGRKLLSRWTTSACGVYGGLTDCLVCHGEIHGNPSRESMSSTGLSFLKMGCILNVHGIL